ncbi:MAG: AraC family transcriptional regulator [Pseudomonadales bacterium]
MNNPQSDKQDMNDALSDVFRLIRLKSCVYFQRDFFAPWGMKIGGTGFAHFHVITRGQCIVEVDGRFHTCSVGDVLFFPNGTSHTLADEPGRDAIPGSEVLASFNEEAECFSHGEVSTRLICGHYETRTDLTHPLLADLPPFVHIKDLNLLPNATAPSVLPLLMREVAISAAGSSSIIERYAEVLLIEVLREYSTRAPNRTGFLRGLTDRRLVRAIDRIHCDFSRPLGLDDIAESAAMSKSALSQRFKDTTGLAPIEYLSRWRMLNAADLLQETDASVAQVSAQVGYESEIAFARAFKREFGVTPSSYRRSV